MNQTHAWDWEAIKTLVTIVSVIVAVISLGFNAYQFRQIRNFRPTSAKKEEIRNALNSLMTKIDSTQILTIPPHHENWILGFPSLEELRALCAAANTLVENSTLPPPQVKTVTATMLEKVKTVLNFRDSFSYLKKNRLSLSLEDYQKWKQKREAENALHDLQQYVVGRIHALRDYVRELNR
jgi:hypothetical protein